MYMVVGIAFMMDMKFRQFPLMNDMHNDVFPPTLRIRNSGICFWKTHHLSHAASWKLEHDILFGMDGGGILAPGDLYIQLSVIGLFPNSPRFLWHIMGPHRNNWLCGTFRKCVLFLFVGYRGNYIYLVIVAIPNPFSWKSHTIHCLPFFVQFLLNSL